MVGRRGGTLAVAMTLLLFFVFGSAVQGTTSRKSLAKDLSEKLRTARTQRQLVQAVNQLKIYREHEQQRVRAALQRLNARERLLRKAHKAITPDVRMHAGVLAIRSLLSKGQSFTHVLAKSRKSLEVTGATEAGQIRGRVTVAGQAAEGPIEVVAFDTLGYVANVTETGQGNTEYALQVAPGRYYLMTVSTGYVDEMYEDVPAPFGSKAGWRSATLVSVTSGTETTGVDFDLATGVTITGTIYDSEGYPLGNTFVTFRLTSALNPIPLLEYETWTETNGAYTIHVPAAGVYKLAANSEGYTQVWYDAKGSWDEADTLVLESVGTTLQGIDFTLPRQEEGIGVPGEIGGGAISGTVKGPGGIRPVVAALAVAFDLSDSSVAGLGLGILDSPYVISGLAEGQYLVYADDILGDFLGIGNYVGEFYDDAQTPDEATPVSVTEGDTTTGIDFELEAGGSIQGQVVGPDNQPMDSVLVLAIDAQILGAFDDPFLTHVRVGMDLTDESGQFSLTGLREGDYVLRTVTVSELGGQVLDEYWDGHHSIWAFREADRVHIDGPNSVVTVNITLDAPGRIKGHVYASDGSTPIPGTAIFALNAASGLPELAYGEAGEDGAYTLSPLPTGDYKLLAISGDDQHLSEFYDGVYSLDDASVVHVEAPNTTSDIDFTLNEGAEIRGFVHLPDGATVGADTTYRFPVVAYDATSGALVDYAYVQFPGGFRIHKLLPGQYKVAALPVLHGYAVTYVGGGDTYDDPASQIIVVAAGEASDVSITLEQGAGSIRGSVVEQDTGEPLDFALVMAYDATGHAAGFAVAGADPEKMMPGPSPGEYIIRGLRPGNYFVRTFAFTHIFPQVSSMDLENFEFDLGEGGFPAIPGLGGEMGDLFHLYRDEWFDDVPVENAKITLDALYTTLFTFLRHGFAEDYEDDLIPFYLPLPFQDTPPSGASPVAVTQGGEGQADFALTGADVQEITGLQEETASVPTDFVLSRAYPNPFNPTTRLRLALPRAARVRVAVYDLLGHKVRHLADEVLPGGTYTLTWDATNDQGETLPSGLYFVRVEAGAFRATRKLLLLK